MKPPVYPFTAIIGQGEMKLALLLNVIDPLIGGVLIMGHRGTGKSTAVRALADLLPEIARVRACAYGCDPAEERHLCGECLERLEELGKLSTERGKVIVVDLPLGATEDRVCGTINLERALKEGVKAFEPGLLARANRGFLYIDEVNLLEDHLIDLLLDVAVTGHHTVEREGVSVEHPARFVLIGSGNPEEGELRPQLIDRFGLSVEVRTVTDLDERVRIVEQREAFERDPESFRASLENEQGSLRRRISRARKNLHAVKLLPRMLRVIAELCQTLQIDGHRGELTIARAARALAALEGRKEVLDEDVRRVAAFALRHRLRRDPLDQNSGGQRVAQQLDKLLPQDSDAARTEPKGGERKREKSERNLPPGGSDGSNGARKQLDQKRDGAGDGPEQLSPPALDAKLSHEAFDSVSQAPNRRNFQNVSSRRQSKPKRSTENARRGRYVRASDLKTPGARIALDATLRAAAQKAGARGQGPGAGALALAHDTRHLTPFPSQALRYKRFKRKAGTLFIFAVDTSGSMALNRIAQAKGALIRLLQHSYIRRDRVALVSFRGQEAEVLLPPSASVTRARRLLDELSIGGATPLAAGLERAIDVALRAGRQGTERIVLLLFTDGRANVPLRMEAMTDKAALRRLIQEELAALGAAIRKAGVAAFVIDTQNRFTSSGESQKLADLLSAHYVQLESVVGQAFLPV